MSFSSVLFRQVSYSKFYPPKRHPRFFSRSHLLESLDSINDNKYTLLQAPEGYGKSSLLSEWYHSVKNDDNKRVLWFRVDAHDVDPECFWSNLLETMDGCWPGIREATINSMDLLEQSAIAQIVLTLANYIVRFSDENLQYILIFDDFESFKLSESEAQFFVFANMLPANINFVIASEEYLNNQLIGQGAYSQFSLLGINELAVAKSELSEMFEDNGHSSLPQSLIDDIYLKTEGWLLAIYSLLEQTSTGVSLENAVKELSGTDRFFGDIVFRRVTELLPQKAVMFLLETSFFEYFSEQLCNSVFDNKGAQAIIQDLERRGIFIFAKDSSRVWYRYHYLFAEWLQHNAMSMHRDQIRSLNFKAASWYHANGKKLLSAKHIVAASEGNFISDLSKFVFTRSSIEDTDLLSYLLHLREDMLTKDPFFCLLASWAYVFSGKPNEAKEWLYRTKDLVLSGQATVGGTLIVHENPKEEHSCDKGLENRINLVSQIIESKCLVLEGEAQLGIEKTEALLLEQGPFLDDRLKMVLYQDLGEAFELLGDTDIATKYYQKTMTIAQVNGYDFLVGFTRYQIIHLVVEQGKLSEAEVLCRTALASCPPDFTVYGALYSILGLVKILQRKYDELDVILKRATGRVSLDRNIDIFLDVCRSRLHYLVIKKNYSEALLQAAVARNAIIGNRDNPPRGTAPLTYAEQARLYLTLGDVDSVKDTMQEFESLNYPDTAEGALQRAILNALVAIEEDAVSKDTVSELSVFLSQAEKGKYLLYQIEIYLLIAKLNYILNAHNEAVKALKKALDLARKERIIQHFLTGGEPIRLLLAELVGTRGLSYESDKFARMIIASFSEPETAINREKQGSDWVSSSPEKGSVSFVGHWGLTSREDEVLQLLVCGMNRKEIAAELCTSQNTIKTHISHIYEKMDVHSVSELLRKMVDSEVL